MSKSETTGKEQNYHLETSRIIIDRKGQATSASIHSEFRDQTGKTIGYTHISSGGNDQTLFVGEEPGERKDDIEKREAGRLKRVVKCSETDTPSKGSNRVNQIVAKYTVTTDAGGNAVKRIDSRITFTHTMAGDPAATDKLKTPRNDKLTVETVMINGKITQQRVDISLPNQFPSVNAVSINAIPNNNLGREIIIHRSGQEGNVHLVFDKVKNTSPEGVFITYDPPRGGVALRNLTDVSSQREHLELYKELRGYADGCKADEMLKSSAVIANAVKRDIHFNARDNGQFLVP